MKVDGTAVDKGAEGMKELNSTQAHSSYRGNM